MFVLQIKSMGAEVLAFTSHSNIILSSFDIAPFPYKHAQKAHYIPFIYQGIDVDIPIVN